MHELLYAFWFFVPAGFANAAPIVVAKLPGLRHWKTPIDLGHTYRGKPLLGKSKTWRGLTAGTVVGSLLFVLLQQLGRHLGSFSVYLSAQGYEQLPWVTGALLGAGALLGDAVKSFFKRRQDIAPGHSWFPLDQLDYILGASLLVVPVAVLSADMYLLILLVWLGMHLLFSYVGYLLHFKERPI
jgi:CDP-2,3-bis-(O-geranylgeranyl)-sn-glycerol synthase